MFGTGDGGRGRGGEDGDGGAGQVDLRALCLEAFNTLPFFQSINQGRAREEGRACFTGQMKRSHWSRTTSPSQHKSTAASGFKHSHAPPGDVTTGVDA